MLVKDKLPPYPVGKIVHIPYPFISQIGQPPSIGGGQICNPPLIISNQGSSCTDSTHERPYHQIPTIVATPKIPTIPLGRTYSFIKKLHDKMTNGLQPDPTVSQWELFNKTLTKNQWSPCNKSETSPWYNEHA